MKNPNRINRKPGQARSYPTRPAHFGNASETSISFEQAYAAINADEILNTAAGTPFTAHAAVVARGRHAGERVILFKRDGGERARVYACCWPYQTNCNRTYISMYVPALIESISNRSA